MREDFAHVRHTINAAYDDPQIPGTKSNRALAALARIEEQLERRGLALKQIAGVDGYGGHLAPEDSEYLAREALKDA